MSTKLGGLNLKALRGFSSLTHYHIPSPNTALNGYVSNHPVLRVLDKELGHVHDGIWVFWFCKVFSMFVHGLYCQKMPIVPQFLLIAFIELKFKLKENCYLIWLTKFMKNFYDFFFIFDFIRC